MIPLSLLQITGQEGVLRIFKNVWFNRFARQEKITKELLALTDAQLEQLLKNKALTEVIYDNDTTLSL